jgi:hypothetical protein
MEMVLSDHIEWLPEIEALSGKWLLVRALNRDTNVFDRAPKQAVKLGGLWWEADHKNRELVPLSLYHHLGDPIFPDWEKSLSPYCVGPLPVTTPTPDEWCDIPDSVMARLVNRLPIPVAT